MNHRERMLAVLNYRSYDRLPVVHFGFWTETLAKWAQEGHLSEELARGWRDNTPEELEINKLLGFDANWSVCFGTRTGLYPGFEPEVVKVFPDGSQHVRNSDGVVVLTRPDAGSIPAEIKHLLEDRESWEEHYRHRFVWSEDRITSCNVRTDTGWKSWGNGGLDFLRNDRRDEMYGIYCGSLFGNLRNILGVEGSCYLQADDPELFCEIITLNADIAYRNLEYVLAAGAKFDFAHIWEDICYKNGPLITPAVFAEEVGPHYKRLTDLLHRYDIDIVSLDCDGLIDALLPIWLENGVNTMFPIEVGTWNASIAPWRAQYGKELRGVGGMNKVVFSRDRAAIDAEIERMRPLVALGGFIPCPDHRIAPDAKWDLVRYYADQMRHVFG